MLVYGYKRKGRAKKSILIEVLASQRDYFPWVVFPTLLDGGTYHAFVLIDDIIFDTSTAKALQRNMETMKLLLGENHEVPHVRH